MTVVDPVLGSRSPIIERRGALYRPTSHFFLFLPAFLFTMAVTIIPIFYAVYQSVHSARYMVIGPYVGLQNFIDYLGGENGIFASLIFCVGSLALAVPLGVGSALALMRIERGRNVFRTVIIAPWLLSNLVVALLWGWLLNAQLGPVGYGLLQLGIRMPNPATSSSLAMLLLILTNAWAMFPLIMVMSFAALQTIPKDTLDAAAIDGANGTQQVRWIVLPMIKSTILVAVILTTIHTLNNATLVLVLTGGGPGSLTETVALRVFYDGFKFYRMGIAAAGSLVVFALNLIFAVFYFRTLRSEA